MGGTVTDPAMIITDHMIAVDHELTHLPAKVALQLIEFSRRRLDASEARVLADRYEKGASDRDVENMAGDNKTSKTEAKKRARRAKATNANPDLANRMEKGTMSSEQADIIAKAAEDTDGEAACDKELIDAVSGTNPEQGKKKAREYVNKRTKQDDVQKRHDKQHRRRGVYRHRLENGNSALTIHGSTEHIDEIERSIHAGSNTEYQNDGGRDTPTRQHARSHDQRNFDAAHKLLTGSTIKADKDTATKKPVRQATIFITSTIDQWTGKDPSPMTSIDGKPLPRSYVEEIAGGAAFIAQVFSQAGELLWQGHKHRLATPAQINGLISRDKGCTQCGASVDKCVAHHLLPSGAPRRGPTNINNLALLCVDCHTRLHADQRTMFYDIKTQTWKTRPATPDEIPPTGKHKPGKAPPGKYRSKTDSRVYVDDGRTKPAAHERQRKPSLKPKAASLFHGDNYG